MGTYLSHPVKEKVSESAENNVIGFGATAMQGWRLNQEDSHNCILHFDQNCSMFAVYDGHGGAEVSDYASKKLNEFVKSAPSWSRGDISRALMEAFLTFDQSLTTPQVIEELHRIKIERKNADERDDVNGVDSDRNDEPTCVPFEKMLERFGIRFRFNDESPFSDDDVFITRKASTSDDKRAKCDDNLDAADLPLTPPSSPATAQPCSQTDVGVVDSDAQVPRLVPDQSSSPQPPSAVPAAAVAATGSSSCVNMDEDVMSSSVDVQTLPETDGVTMQISSMDEAPPNKELLSTNDDSNVAQFNHNIIDSKEKICTTMETSSDDGDDAKKFNMEVESVEVKGDANEVEMESDYEQELIVMPNSGEVVSPGADSGSTACVVVIKEDTLYVANAGDSRCVLCRNGTAVDMSVDHKPEDKSERDRIEKAGGKVTPDGRVNGGLNLSRAFGDHSYKKNAELPPEEQMISAYPDVRVEPLTPNDKFLIVACDGIWNSMTSQELVDFVALRLGKGQTPVQVCEEVCDTCLAPSTIGDGTGCDNMTIIIVILKQLTNG